VGVPALPRLGGVNQRESLLRVTGANRNLDFSQTPLTFPNHQLAKLFRTGPPQVTEQL
jgi:hypothetical protein